ncbi:hypothetical protein Pmani_029831 [Petrolisthes manimaculis]|uniref:Uncharacterized protein n=1 Tax=Petrolisthes manimaculis TaxID=1843537 RepID=A0AAE1TWL6_9EUCA|nr:hypothetical protein Pmani_029831 [Petrolisthes manimaculis]
MKYGDNFVRSMRRSLRIKKSKSVTITNNNTIKRKSVYDGPEKKGSRRRVRCGQRLTQGTHSPTGGPGVKIFLGDVGGGASNYGYESGK